MRICLLLSLCLIFGCAGYPRDVEEMRKLTADIEARRDRLEQKTDTWRSGDVSSSFTAYGEGEDIRFIEERMVRGESGQSVNRYYFFDEKLFCYRETRTNRDDSTVEIEVLFDEAGQVVASSQRLNGTPTAVEYYIAAMATKHAKTLRDLASGTQDMEE